MQIQITHTLLGALLTFAAACSSPFESADTLPRSIEPTEAQRVCTADDDCLATYTISNCGCIACESAAVNVESRAGYHADFEDVDEACGQRVNCGSLEPTRTHRQATSCGGTVAECNAGLCELVAEEDGD